MTGKTAVAHEPTQNLVLNDTPKSVPRPIPVLNQFQLQDPMTDQDTGNNDEEVLDQSISEQAVEEVDGQIDEPVIPAVKPNLERSRVLALAAAQTAQENGGSDIVILDMSGITSIFDYFVIATGTSQRQLVAMSEEIRIKLEKDLKDRRISLDGQDSGKWIVLDFGSVVIHLFDEDTRQFYSLEALWADAKNVTADFGFENAK